jgi:hypothetical protein
VDNKHEYAPAYHRVVGRWGRRNGSFWRSENGSNRRQRHGSCHRVAACFLGRRWRHQEHARQKPLLVCSRRLVSRCTPVRHTHATAHHLGRRSRLQLPWKLVGWTRKPSLFGLELLDKELELRRSGVGQLSESGRNVWQDAFWDAWWRKSDAPVCWKWGKSWLSTGYLYLM